MKYAFTGDDAPPSSWKHLAELSWTVPRVLRRFGRLGPHGPHDGEPAMVIPGFVAGDRATMTLRKALAAAGWRVHGWSLGFNKGAHPDILKNLRRELEKIHDGRPVLLIGWSLGGLFARELAREVPDKVRAVVTLGSPFSGDPHQNNIWPFYELVAGHKVDAPPIGHLPDKPPVPTLALWSRRDGIVAPRAARGFDGERDTAIELESHHMAFAISKRVASDIVREIDGFLSEFS